MSEVECKLICVSKTSSGNSKVRWKMPQKKQTVTVRLKRDGVSNHLALWVSRSGMMLGRWEVIPANQLTQRGRCRICILPTDARYCWLISEGGFSSRSHAPWMLCSNIVSRTTGEPLPAIGWKAIWIHCWSVKACYRVISYCQLMKV